MREIIFKAKTTKKDNPINAFNNVWVKEIWSEVVGNTIFTQ